MKIKHLTVSLLSLACALAVPFSSSFAAENLLRGNFIKGVNLPWLDGQYDHDIGTNPNDDSTCTFDAAHINQYFAGIHALGMTVVRIWLMENEQGLLLDANGNVSGLEPLFLTNLDKIVALAKANNISLYLTLLNGNDDFEEYLTNPNTQALFISKAVKPLAARYKGNPAIFAIDVNNEIDAMVAPTQPDSNGFGNCTWAEVKTYIKNTATAIHTADPTRLVSCSAGFDVWYNLYQFQGQGLDFYDFHEYKDDPTVASSNPDYFPVIPPAASLNLDKPIIIGECGQLSTTYSDSIQSNCILKFLSSAQTNGYSGVLPWDYCVSEYPPPAAGKQDFLSMNTWTYDADRNVTSFEAARPVCASVRNWNYTLGTNDLVLVDPANQHTEIWTLTGPTFTSSHTAPTLPAVWNLAAVADANGDGQADYILEGKSTDSTAVWILNNGTRAQTLYGPTLPSGSHIDSAGDFDKDGKADWVVSNATTGVLSIWFMDGATRKSMSNIVDSKGNNVLLPGSGWSVGGVGDFNRDGQLDLLLTGPSGAIKIYYLNGTTCLSQATGPALNSGLTLVRVEDINHDGCPDLVLYQASTNHTAVWYLEGLNHYASAPGPVITAGWQPATP